MLLNCRSETPAPEITVSCFSYYFSDGHHLPFRLFFPSAPTAGYYGPQSGSLLLATPRGLY